MADGKETTVHVAAFDLANTRLRVVRTDEGEDMEASSPSTTAFVLERLS